MKVPMIPALEATIRCTAFKRCSQLQLAPLYFGAASRYGTPAAACDAWNPNEMADASAAVSMQSNNMKARLANQMGIMRQGLTQPSPRERGRDRRGDDSACIRNLQAFARAFHTAFICELILRPEC